MVSIRKVLFPTDFSECSHAAWGHAVTLARQFGAEIVLLHVVAEPPRVAEAIEMGYTPERFLKAATEEAERLAGNLVAEAADRRVLVRSRISRGVAFHAIISVAREEAADLIVMGTHGRTGLSHALMGSVAEKVVRKAPCPVLTVKHPGMKFEMP